MLSHHTLTNPSSGRYSLTESAQGLSQSSLALLVHMIRHEQSTRFLYAALLCHPEIAQSPQRDYFKQALEEDAAHVDELTDQLDPKVRQQLMSNSEHIQYTALPATSATDLCQPLAASGNEDILQQLYQSELAAVGACRRLCTLTLEQDYRLFDLAYRHLQENLLHLETAADLLARARSI